MRKKGKGREGERERERREGGTGWEGKFRGEG